MRQCAAVRLCDNTYWQRSARNTNLGSIAPPTQDGSDGSTRSLRVSTACKHKRARTVRDCAGRPCCYCWCVPCGRRKACRPEECDDGRLKCARQHTLTEGAYCRLERTRREPRRPSMLYRADGAPPSVSSRANQFGLFIK